VDNCASGGSAPPGQEYRAELLQLPYAFKPRPAITGINKKTVRFVASYFVLVVGSATLDGSCTGLLGMLSFKW
jgi:hypothetical protein